MPRLTRSEWAEVRRRYECGDKVGELAKDYKVTVQAICGHVRKEKWSRDYTNSVALRTQEKLDAAFGDAPTEVIEARADTCAEIIRKHREECTILGAMFDAAARERNVTKIQDLRGAYETLLRKMQCDRLAYNIKDFDPTEGLQPVRFVWAAEEVEA